MSSGIEKKVAPPRFPGNRAWILTPLERNEQNPYQLLSQHGIDCQCVYQCVLYHNTRRLMICRTRRHAECITAPQHRARQMCGFHLLPPPWCMLCFRLSAPLSAYRAPSVWVTWYRVACICSALPPCCSPAPPTPFLSGAGSIPHPGRVCGHAPASE